MKRLWIAMAILFLLHLLQGWMRSGPVPPRFAIGWTRVDLGQESSLGTWFSSVTLLLIASTGAWLASAAPLAGDRRCWKIIAVLFLGLSIDEISAFHELMSDPIRSRAKLSGALFLAWVIPAGIAVVGLSLYFARFVFRQPPDIRNGIIIAAALFVGGAIGLELPGSVLYEKGDTKSMTWFVISGLEEFGEMAGVLWMLRTSLRLLEQIKAEGRITFGTA